MPTEALSIVKSITLERIIILAIVVIFISVAAGYRYQMDRPALFANQTVSDAAANMTHILEGFGIAGPEIHSAYVRINPDVCQVEVTAKYAQTVSVFVAPLFATYLKQHSEYTGNLTLKVYSLYGDKTLLMTTTIANADARANYDGIAYLMDKNADYLQDPYSKKADGLETPMGY